MLKSDINVLGTSTDYYVNVRRLLPYVVIMFVIGAVIGSIAGIKDGWIAYSCEFENIPGKFAVFKKDLNKSEDTMIEASDGHRTFMFRRSKLKQCREIAKP